MRHVIFLSLSGISAALVAALAVVQTCFVGAIPAPLPIEDVTFVIENITLSNLSEVPLPGQYTIMFFQVKTTTQR